MYNKVGCIQGKLPERANYFKEEMACQILSIPATKPDLVGILNVMTWVEVEDTKLVETPKGKSYEGQYLSGYKLVVEMLIKTKVTYISQIRDQQGTQAEYYETLKSAFIILPETIEGKTVEELKRLDRLIVTPYIEAECHRALDNRTVYQCLLVLIDVTSC